MKSFIKMCDVPTCDCKGGLECGSECVNMQLFIECAPGCCPSVPFNAIGADRFCKNTVIQRGNFPETVPFPCGKKEEGQDKEGGKGWGLKAVDHISPNQIIGEYRGEVITKQECMRRLAELTDEGSSHFYFAALDGDLILDAGPMGAVTRFCNHSCNPNARMSKWNVLGEPRIALMAIREIQPDDEITFNYAADTMDDFVKRAVCVCGEPNCCGFIGEI